MPVNAVLPSEVPCAPLGWTSYPVFIAQPVEPVTNRREVTCLRAELQGFAASPTAIVEQVAAERGDYRFGDFIDRGDASFLKPLDEHPEGVTAPVDGGL